MANYEIDGASESSTTSKGHYIKYDNGILICYGQAYASENETEAKVMFSFSFINTPTVIATHQWSYDARGQVTIGSLTNDYVCLRIYDHYQEISKRRACHYIAIGRWK
ncbi:MAG: hypothetical protein ACLUVC_02090 [Longibaculum sp.]